MFRGIIDKFRGAERESEGSPLQQAETELAAIQGKVDRVKSGDSDNEVLVQCLTDIGSLTEQERVKEEFQRLISKGADPETIQKSLYARAYGLAQDIVGIASGSSQQG